MTLVPSMTPKPREILNLQVTMAKRKAWKVECRAYAPHTYHELVSAKAAQVPGPGMLLQGALVQSTFLQYAFPLRLDFQ
ncbi:hypothetical protein PoB_005168800 [Plakobranchus ocellatus]|uniref:Uncharacterized protein n=1 Tax=Plakobranchus ocellatus TaxID=259542 RepID=A0AAV4C2G6_9GAST|nr:hypothetical protein PoB_005168800 [Plakobranchus ocellatus]